MARPKSLALVAAEDEAARLRAQVYDLSDQRGRWEDLLFRWLARLFARATAPELLNPQPSGADTRPAYVRFAEVVLPHERCKKCSRWFAGMCRACDFTPDELRRQYRVEAVQARAAYVRQAAEGEALRTAMREADDAGSGIRDP